MKGYENIVRVIETHIGFQWEQNRVLYDRLGQVENDLKAAEQQLEIYKTELVNISREYQKDREKWAGLEKKK
jgi:hypothetical protein